MLNDDTLLGIAIGLVLALVIGVVGRFLLWALDAIGAFFAPQTVRSQQQTARTPFQLLCGCLLAAAALSAFAYAVWFLLEEFF